VLLIYLIIKNHKDERKFESDISKDKPSNNDLKNEKLDIK